ncbi:MAG: hypothetical protein PHC34_10140 [Candidatus Gastranaerophilales bacterium]|nr:hypothetical protein [Candidatus Gastranaerophilales bacterium]
MTGLIIRNLSNRLQIVNFRNKLQAEPKISSTTEETDVNFRARHFGLINIHSNKTTANISFSGINVLTCVHPKELKVIRTIMARCHYMEDVKHMINSDKFKVTPYKNVIVLDDFYSLESSGKDMYGLCAELSFKVAKELEKQFGSKYKYLVISGSHKVYSRHHYCVAVCKNSSKNSFNCIGSLPDDALIIDPSFGLLGLKKDTIFRDHVFNKLEDRQHSTKSNICFLRYDERDATLLGKVQLLAPGLFKEIKSLDKNTLIRFLFSEPYGSKPAKLYLCTHSPDGISYLDDSTLKKCLSEDDLLKKWIDKTEKTMQQPIDDIFSAF